MPGESLMIDAVRTGEAGLCPAADRDCLNNASRRRFIHAAGLLAAAELIPSFKAHAQVEARTGTANKIIVVIIGGVRRAETFSPDGLANIPHLARDLAPRGLFYSHIRNDGVTAHFNAIASILTGNWQRVDDWGKLAPTTPTIFEQFRKDQHAGHDDTWMIASNKALTSLIGASSDRDYGQPYGANVVFPKQLMLVAVADALRRGRAASFADRSRVEAELESAMAGSNYEGLGWNVFDAAGHLDPRTQSTLQDAIAGFVRGGGPTSGDELTFFMTREVMRKFAPRLLVVAFSDVEAAHFGSYALHVAGIRTADRLAWQLWQEAEQNDAYRGRTTLLIVPEFGRDPDGSSTNGFFNHRANEASTRDTWMIALGAAIDHPRTIERPIRHVDLCPTLAGILRSRSLPAQGTSLLEIRA